MKVRINKYSSRSTMAGESSYFRDAYESKAILDASDYVQGMVKISEGQKYLSGWAVSRKDIEIIRKPTIVIME